MNKNPNKPVSGMHKEWCNVYTGTSMLCSCGIGSPFIGTISIPVSEPCKECHRTDGMYNLSCKTGAQKDWDSSEGQTHSFGDGCIPAHEEKIWNCNANGSHEIDCPHLEVFRESLTYPFHYESQPQEKNADDCRVNDCPCPHAEHDHPKEKSAPSKCPNCGRSSEVVDMASCPYCTPEKSNDCKCQRCDPFKEKIAQVDWALYAGKEKDMFFSCLSMDCPERTGGKCKTAPEEKSAQYKYFGETKHYEWDKPSTQEKSVILPCPPECGLRLGNTFTHEHLDTAPQKKSDDCKCKRCDPFKENSAEECQRAGCYHERAKHVDDYLSCSIVGCRCGAFFIFSSKPPTPSKAEDWENELYELIENGKPFKTFLFVQDLLETHGAKEYERGKNENLKGSRNRLLYESAREEGYKVGKEEKHQLTLTIETNAREAQLREDIAAIERSFYDAATLHQERVSSGDTWEISKRDFNAIISLLKSKLPQD